MQKIKGMHKSNEGLKEQEQKPSKMPTSRNTWTKKGDDEQKHMNQQMNKSKNQPKIIMHKTLQDTSFFFITITNFKEN